MEDAIPGTILGTAGTRASETIVLRAVIGIVTAGTAGTAVVVVGTTAAAAVPGIVTEHTAVVIRLVQIDEMTSTVTAGIVMTVAETMIAETMIAGTTTLATVAVAIIAMGAAQVDTVVDLLAVDAMRAGIGTTEARVATTEVGTATIPGTAIRGIAGMTVARIVGIAAMTIAVVMVETAVMGIETVAMTEIVRILGTAIVAVMTILEIKSLCEIPTTTAQ